VRVKLVLTTFVLLLAAGVGRAEASPPGSSLITFEERLAIWGCEPDRGRGVLGLVMHATVVFEREPEAGHFSGFMTPLDRGARTWRLVFDDASLSLYSLYLRAGANALCGEEVALSGGEIQTALLRFKRDGRASLTLRATAEGRSASGARRIRHRMSGTGIVAPFPEVGPQRTRDSTAQRGRADRCGVIGLVAP
jgi:hypothetical protein